MISLARLCPGVSIQPGDSLVYNVKSESRSAVIHRVDFTAWSGFGECSCEQFLCRVAPVLRNGIPPHPQMECSHIQSARRYLAMEAIQAIIEKRKADADENRKKNKHKPSEYEDENCPY